MVDKSVSLPRSCEAGVKPALGGYGGDVGMGSYVLCMSDGVVVQYQYSGQGSVLHLWSDSGAPEQPDIIY
ncbi:hypothetical protein TSUD_164540 [Trifolium subterraneum]|uniref:Uncharacterized protein n=1 Tax=Trifolium subterraneum TaxID=3900 RepID=A0A2Z6MAN7_TRISU|nr:hypothetical protein TSUD_164540 [Trifolium subterraneum]